MKGPSRQRGLSLLGFIFVGAVVLGAGFVVFRAVPAYIEYFTVQKVLASTMSKVSNEISPYELRREFDLIASADFIDSVKGKDLEVLKEGGKLVVNAVWERRIHIFGNVWVLLEFETTARK